MRQSRKVSHVEITWQPHVKFINKLPIPVDLLGYIFKSHEFRVDLFIYRLKSLSLWWIFLAIYSNPVCLQWTCGFIENTLHGNLKCTERYLACNGCSVSTFCLLQKVTLENANSKQPEALLRFASRRMLLRASSVLGQGGHQKSSVSAAPLGVRRGPVQSYS